MATVKGRPTEPIPLHRVLREVYRHYLEFRDHVSRTGRHVIDHGYFIYEDDGETVKDRIAVSISFWDLHHGLKDLSPRKREAVFHNVILDKKQRDVAEEMGITTVSVGQYVEQAMISLAKRYFSEMQDAPKDEAMNESKQMGMEQGRRGNRGSVAARPKEALHQRSARDGGRRPT